MGKGEEKCGNGLTLKQRKFVEFYLGIANGNATKAARMAGYKHKIASVQGCENLSKPNIRAAIDARLASMARSTDEIVARISDQAWADIGDLHDLVKIGVSESGGTILNVDLKEARRRGKSRLIRRITTTSIELVDSQAALDKLARIHGLYKTPSSVAPESGTESTDDSVEELERLLDRIAASGEETSVPGDIGPGEGKEIP